MKNKTLLILMVFLKILLVSIEVFASNNMDVQVESFFQFSDDADDSDDPFADDDDDKDSNDSENPFAEEKSDEKDPFAEDDDADPFGSTPTDKKTDKTDDDNDEIAPTPRELTATDIKKMLGLDKFIWRGYFENQLSGSEMDKRFFLQNYNKLRLELVTTTKESDADETFADLNIAMIGQTFHGQKSIQTLDYIPSKFSSLIASADRDSYFFSFSDDFRLEVGEVVLNTGRMQFRLGKIMLKTGTGNFFNPTDVFMQKNPSDPGYETAGIPAVSAEYFIEYDPPISVGALIAFDETFRYSTKLAFLKYFLRFGDEITADTRVQFASRNENFITDYQTFDETLQTLDQIGFDVHFNLLGLGLGFEIAYNMSDVQEDWLAALAQVDYTFANGIFCLLEYYYDESGKTKSDEYDFNDWLGYIFGAKLTMGQHYVAFASQYQASIKFTFSMSGFVNLSDNSAALIQRVDWSILDAVQLNFYALIPVGAKETEFGTLGTQLILRFRYSFTSN
ncbi:MAG: hypothetical protein K8S87_03470 [Planctomycetes bacterium]|nr:hypothetical protein [Planctomycetota bacterium]